MKRAKRRRTEHRTHSGDALETVWRRAVAHHHEGRHAQAEQLYRRILSAARDHGTSRSPLPERFEVLGELGNALLPQGKLDEAVAVFRQALELAPGSAKTHFNLGQALQAQGKLSEASTAYRHAISLKPDAAVALINLGVTLEAQHHLDEAEAACRRAIELKPNIVEAHLNLGVVLMRQGQLAEAIEASQTARALKPDSAKAHNNLGMALKAQGNWSEALFSFQRALELAPDFVQSLANLGALYEESNRLTEARSVLARGLKLAPHDPQLNFVTAKCERREGKFADAANRLVEILGSRLNPTLTGEIHYELGRLYDITGRPEQAFGHFNNANGIQAQLPRHRGIDKNEFLREITSLEAHLTQNWIASWTPRVDGGEKRVFSIGFPRSGTTLLDQILDCHPRLQTLEERPTVSILGQAIANLADGYPRALARLTADEIGRLRKQYDQAVDQFLVRRPDSTPIDKLPLNTLKVPLIWRVFPDAKYLLSIRHPCDVCLSCFMQNFTINSAMANFFSLEDAAHLYAKVMGLWLRFERLFPLEYHVVKYEDLVTDVEAVARQTIEFLGVPWDDAVLEHTEHARRRGPINTPSYHQVTEPIYQRAKYRWRRYSTQLAPVMEVLAPFIEHFGYTDD